MDFAEDTKRLRLHSLHAGVSEAEVRAQTGFALTTAAPIPATDPPSAEELHVLRTRVDPSGFLRR
jgi:glutaconate CoA-transferase subunit B